MDPEVTLEITSRNAAYFPTYVWRWICDRADHGPLFHLIHAIFQHPEKSLWLICWTWHLCMQTGEKDLSSDVDMQRAENLTGESVNVPTESTCLHSQGLVDQSHFVSCVYCYQDRRLCSRNWRFSSLLSFFHTGVHF